jgi:hypothetical protein
MHKILVAMGAMALLLGITPAWAGEHSHRLSQRDVAGASTCEEMNVNFGDRETLSVKEEFAFPAGQLDVTAPQNGGVSLRRGDGNQYQVQLCKFVAAENQSAAQQLLGQIQVQKGAGKLSVTGPQDEHEWSASMIIRVPAGSSMNVEAHNGPLSARDVNGSFNLNTVNGPISVENITGKMAAKAKNGPISFVGDGGEFNFETQNGPISIRLNDQSWKNGSLDANAHNGPISLQLPRGYLSGVVLSAKDFAPMSCSADVCSEARKSRNDGEKKIEFGPSNPVIRISTVNGPVSVRPRDSKGDL